MQVPAELARRQIKQERGHERQVRPPQHRPQHRRKDQHQQDVKRQHIHVDRLECEDEALIERLGRIVHETRDVEFILQVWIAVAL